MKEFLKKDVEYGNAHYKYLLEADVVIAVIAGVIASVQGGDNLVELRTILEERFAGRDFSYIQPTKNMAGQMAIMHQALYNFTEATDGLSDEG
ncbi:MAG TPA: hypothetical protein PKD15_00670 [Candidatus Saccharibacteria bacterium]|nr:hypothetical protein [Candidatus Saccharibacteria bacterium]